MDSSPFPSSTSQWPLRRLLVPSFLPSIQASYLSFSSISQRRITNEQSDRERERGYALGPLLQMLLLSWADVNSNCLFCSHDCLHLVGWTVYDATQQEMTPSQLSRSAFQLGYDHIILQPCLVSLHAWPLTPTLTVHIVWKYSIMDGP